MRFLPLLHFFSFLVYLYLAVFVLYKNFKSLLNRICAVIMVCFAIWSFGMIFLHNPDTSREIATLVENMDSVGWISFSSFFLWFVFIFIGRKRILRSKIFYIVILSLPLLLIYKQWTGALITHHVKQAYGWSDEWAESIWTYLYYLYYLSFMGWGLYLVLNFGKKTKNLVKKKQSRIIFTVALIPLIIGSFTNVILPELDLYEIPNMADVTTLIWASGIVYAIVKYKFLTITPATAADNIISTMTDALILLDPKTKIVSINQATVNLLGYKRGGLKDKSIEMILPEEKFERALLAKIRKGEDIKGYDLNFRAKSGKSIPVSLSSSVLRNAEGSIAGTVCIARDIAERKRMEEALKEKVDELERINKVMVGRELEMTEMKKEIAELKAN